VVAVGPAVEVPVLYRRHVVGYQVAADLVTFVHRRPEPAVMRLPGQPVGIAQSGCKDAGLAGCRVHQPDGGTSDLVFHAVLADVAVGPYGHVQPAAVGTGNHVLRPVMVDRTGRKIGHLGSLPGQLHIALVVGITHEGVRIGDVEI